MASTGKKDASPDEFDEWGDDLSRALGGVQGFDLDALDLEMDDLGPEDLEVCVMPYYRVFVSYSYRA